MAYSVCVLVLVLFFPFAIAQRWHAIARVMYAHKLHREIIRVARILDLRSILCIFNSFSLFSFCVCFVARLFLFSQRKQWACDQPSVRTCLPFVRCVSHATAYFILIVSWAGSLSVCNNHPIWAGSKRKTTTSTCVRESHWVLCVAIDHRQIAVLLEFRSVALSRMLSPKSVPVLACPFGHSNDFNSKQDKNRILRSLS